MTLEGQLLAERRRRGLSAEATARLLEVDEGTYTRWERGRWPVEHIEAVVEHAKTVVVGAAVPVDVFDKTVTIRAPLLDADRVARLMEIAGNCPVHRVLEGASKIRPKAGASAPEH